MEKLSEDAQKALSTDISLWALFTSQDHLNLAFQVYKRCRNKRSHFNSSTAGTMSQHAAVAKSHNLIIAMDVPKLEHAASPCLKAQSISRVIQFLINTPLVDFDTYEYKHNPIFSPLPPRQQLPTGKDHAICQYLLDNVHLESASQEGIRMCMDEWMRQLKFDSPLETL
ncbi:hypothetical protein BC835DRAFT_1455515 [Cytidiella melzeri]|nr:hypothetical protein BC835DRAFT_1455515 [Cytidiella melzeri]